MYQEFIEIRGARGNNLKDVTLKIPKRAITIFTGVSGSGKSSIVFDTIATEAQRQLYENFTMFVRNFLPRYALPHVDAIENLSMPIVVDQKKVGRWLHFYHGYHHRYRPGIMPPVFARGQNLWRLFQCVFV
jgi:Excinuclease ATPase subunit